MILKEQKIKSTIEDYEATPVGGKYQFIDSEIIEMPSPTPEHQEVLQNIFYDIKTFLKINKLGKAFLAPLDVQLNNSNIFQPDIFFISNDKLEMVKKKRVFGAPDLVIEVLSEGTSYYDYTKKKQTYLSSGVIEYWIVDIENKLIEIYHSLNGEYTLSSIFKKGKKLESLVLKELSLNIEDIFA